MRQRNARAAEDSPSALLRAFVKGAAALTVAVVVLELAPARTPARRSSVKQRYGAGRPAPPAGGPGSSASAALSAALPTLSPPVWTPPLGFNHAWTRKAVAKMLEPWATGGVDRDFATRLDEWTPFLNLPRRRKACWSVVTIRGMEATRTGCKGNGRYWSILMDALSYMRRENITAQDSVIVLSKGDDEPMVVKGAPGAAKLPIPFVVSMTNNGSFYDIVFPTVTRSSFVGKRWEGSLDGIARKAPPFAERNGSRAVWRGSRPTTSSTTGAAFWNHPRVLLARLSENGTLPCVDARLKPSKRPALLGDLADDDAWARLSWSGEPLDFGLFQFVLNVGNNGFVDRTKNLLAAGNVVLYVDNGFIEWYYPALQHGVHHFAVPVAGVRRVCETVTALQRSPSAAATVSRNAQTFARTVLRVDVRNMYVAEVLVQWGRLYNL